MSDPVSALNGARYQGRVTVTEAGVTGMVTLRCDIAGATAKSAIARISGTDLPGQGQVTTRGDTSLLWMAPDELLLLCPHADVPRMLAELDAALDGRPHLLADVSDARAVFDLQGAAVREVLAKLTPADLRRDRFAPGQVRRTRLAQVPAAIWMPAQDQDPKQDQDRARVIAFRSVAAYVFGLLTAAADPAAAIDHF